MYSQSMPQFTKVPGYTYILFKQYLETNVCFKLENALKDVDSLISKSKESTIFRAFSIT